MGDFKQNIYIENNDDELLKKEFFSLFEVNENKFENVNVIDSVGRITAKPVLALVCDPVYNAAAMDGIQVKAEKTYSASMLNPVELVENIDFNYINTGGAITKDYDSVIMIEDVINAGNDKIKITSPSYPWQYVRTVGESIVTGEMIIPSKHKIRPLDIGALIGGGIQTMEVYKKPVVGIIPTGSELIDDPKDLKEGRLMESNSKVLSALLIDIGALPIRYKTCEDRLEKLKEVIEDAVEKCDIIIINAGSSAGSKDYTSKVINNLGNVFAHGVAVKPGKPTILAQIDKKPVIGLPGYPVSAYLMYEMFVKPLVYKYIGLSEEQDTVIEATISKRVVSSFKHKEILRVVLGYVNDKYIATPLDRGAAAVMSLVRADGIVEISRNVEGLEAGEKINVKLIKPLDIIKETLVSTGSHDLIMDILADKINLSSGHVGSMGGITALKRKECHLAPIHLLDMETGIYNISYVEQYFKGQKMALIKGVNRVQGFIVQKGNPKNITSFEDLKREDIVYANRQKGAGTRILLDYNLSKYNINSEAIIGYEKDFSTHMAVAINVKSNNADTGLGIYSAAKAMDLDFIPVGNEEYDFLIPYEYLEDDRVKAFLEILCSNEFKEQIENMGGYSCEKTGEIIII